MGMDNAAGLPSGLEDAQAQFGLLFSDLPCGAVYLDDSLRILACNDAASRILGLDSDAVAGRSAFDPRWHNIREDGSPFPAEALPSAVCLREGRPVHGVVVGIWNPAERRYRWASLDAQPQFREGSDRPWRVIVWVADVTDRVLAREAEARTRDQFASLFTHMSEGVALHELVFGEGGACVDYRILEVNPRYESQVGIPRDRAVGRLGSEVYGVTPAPYLEQFSAVPLGGSPSQFETYFPPLDKHFMISVAPLGATGFATIFFDISERKRIASERERLMLELERKNQELESIVYVSSHDLRSPLVNIQGFGSRLEKDCAELALRARAAACGEETAARRIEVLALERIPRSVEFIRASAAKMDRLIAGLLRLSRTGRVELFRRSLDMDALLREIASSLAFQMEKAGASLELGSLPPCLGDEGQLSQVFTNLLDNAIKYRAADRPLRIAVRGERRGDEVEYCVEDSGMGIAPEHLERIWELFYRLDPGDGAGGEGLGLSLVRRIVDRHEGRVRVESEPGVGSRFFVLLPAPR